MAAIDLWVTERTIDSLPESGQPLLVIFHLTEDSVKFIRLLGRRFAVVAVVAIPYSLKPAFADDLAQDLKVIVPRGGEEIPQVVEEQLAQSGAPTLILEIGGYCHKLATVHGAKIRGIVEDTTQGHWKYLERRGELGCPVLSVAKTPIKGLEIRAVGPAIAYSSEKVLREQYMDSLQGRRSLVLGYGAVGKSLARSLRSYGSQVSVYDTSSFRRVEALLDGYRIDGRLKLLADAQLIFGASGRRSISQSDVAHLADGVFLVSGSSKQVELETAMFDRLTLSRQRGPVKEYVCGQKRIHLVNDGKPVNFLDCSIPQRVIDLNYAELTLALAKVSSLEPGFYDRAASEDDLCRHWLELTGHDTD